MNKDEEHLRLLAIFHYVLAGLTALMTLIPALYMAAGLFVVYGAKHFQGKGQPPPAFVGWFFVGMGGVMMLFTLTLAILMLINGRSLAKRRCHTSCLVIAGVECLLMPFGTVLGVFTLIVLLREPVKQLFAANAGAPRPPHI